MKRVLPACAIILTVGMPSPFAQDQPKFSIEVDIVPIGGRPRDGEEVLEKLVEETGGALFEVSKKLPLKEIFHRIEEELRNQYILGYTPTEKRPSDDYRRITVKTTNKKLNVQSRTGYYTR